MTLAQARGGVRPRQLATRATHFPSCRVSLSPCSILSLGFHRLGSLFLLLLSFSFFTFPLSLQPQVSLSLFKTCFPNPIGPDLYKNSKRHQECVCAQRNSQGEAAVWKPGRKSSPETNPTSNLTHLVVRATCEVGRDFYNYYLCDK